MKKRRDGALPSLPCSGARPPDLRRVTQVPRSARFASASATGLEPATTGSTVRYSNQLSYAPVGVEGATLYSAVARCQGDFERSGSLQRLRPLRVPVAGARQVRF